MNVRGLASPDSVRAALGSIPVGGRSRSSRCATASTAPGVPPALEAVALLPQAWRDTARAMSQENLEIVQAIYAEAAEGKFETTLRFFHPDVEYSRHASGAGGTAVGLSETARGVEAMVKVGLEWVQTFDWLRVQAERFIEVGDSVVVFVRHTGNAKASGLPIEGEFADVLTLCEGRVIRFEQYRDRAEALEAAGLSE